MNCDFIKTLTPEQKEQLRKALDEPEETSQYRVDVEFWDKEKTRIRNLVEYQGGQPHGKYIGWYENGQKAWEAEYQHGKLIK